MFSDLLLPKLNFGRDFTSSFFLPFAQARVFFAGFFSHLFQFKGLSSAYICFIIFLNFHMLQVPRPMVLSEHHNERDPADADGANDHHGGRREGPHHPQPVALHPRSPQGASIFVCVSYQRETVKMDLYFSTRTSAWDVPPVGPFYTGFLNLLYLSDVPAFSFPITFSFVKNMAEDLKAFHGLLISPNPIMYRFRNSRAWGWRRSIRCTATRRNGVIPCWKFSDW